MIHYLWELFLRYLFHFTLTKILPQPGTRMSLGINKVLSYFMWSYVKVNVRSSQPVPAVCPAVLTPGQGEQRPAEQPAARRQRPLPAAHVHPLPAEGEQQQQQDNKQQDNKQRG